MDGVWDRGLGCRNACTQKCTWTHTQMEEKGKTETYLRGRVVRNLASPFTAEHCRTLNNCLSGNVLPHTLPLSANGPAQDKGIFPTDTHANTQKASQATQRTRLSWETIEWHKPLSSCPNSVTPLLQVMHIDAFAWWSNSITKASQNNGSSKVAWTLSGRYVIYRSWEFQRNFSKNEWNASSRLGEKQTPLCTASDINTSFWRKKLQIHPGWINE